VVVKNCYVVSLILGMLGSRKPDRSLSDVDYLKFKPRIQSIDKDEYPRLFACCKESHNKILLLCKLPQKCAREQPKYDAENTS